MDEDSRRQEPQDDALSLLDLAIEAINLAKEISSITPAKAAFGTAGVLLKMIKVCSPPFSNVLLPAHTQPGLDDKQSRLCRARSSLRRCV